MNTMKHKAPQPEMAIAAEAFNLAAETTQDGDRIQAEAATRAADTALAEQQQRGFYDLPGLADGSRWT